MTNDEVTADMETEWRIARGQLRELLVETPSAHPRELAAQLGYSVGWVRKWRKRLTQMNNQDEQVLCCQSHRPKHLVRQIASQVENRILDLRVTLSEQYHRKVGARTIAAYLRREATEQSGTRAPCSSTIWRVLRRRQVILVPLAVIPHPFVRPDPGLHWEIDFCTVTPRTAEAPDKHQNGLEVFNVVDRGSSANIASLPSAHFDAELALLSMAATLQQHGIPRSITLDRDPRFVGSQSTDGFPSAFTRFLLCLGCAVDILPPRRPDLKPFVERFQRTLKQECLSKHRPTTAAEATTYLQPYCQWYNAERPHQGHGNLEQPPHLRLVDRAPLAILPEMVDPDAWLSHFHNRHYRRHVDSRGSIQLWKATYYVGKAYANQTVLVQLDAPLRAVHVEIGKVRIKTIPLKGLLGHALGLPSLPRFHE